MVWKIVSWYGIMIMISFCDIKMPKMDGVEVHRH
jgi:YesN/AraC family two-component response regulator